jgi:hypothetical protein
MAAEIKILIDGQAFALDDDGMAAIAALRMPRDYRGAEPANAYGDVPVEIAGDTYTLRIGNREWWRAEEVFKKKGVQAIVDHVNASERALAEFYLIALSRHHGKLMTIEKVGELMDWRPADGQPSLRDALERALTFSRPKQFPADEPDPKAQAALMAALLAKAATTSHKESTATT